MKEQWTDLLKKHRLTLVTTFTEEVYGYFLDTSIHQLTGKREWIIQGGHETMTLKMAFQYTDLFVLVEDEKMLFHYGRQGSDVLRLVGKTIQKEPELNPFFSDILALLVKE